MAPLPDGQRIDEPPVLRSRSERELRAIAPRADLQQLEAENVAQLLLEHGTLGSQHRVAQWRFEPAQRLRRASHNAKDTGRAASGRTKNACRGVEISGATRSNTAARTRRLHRQGYCHAR